jgi:putative ABC transport system ATP-binding protein
MCLDESQQEELPKKGAFLEGRSSKPKTQRRERDFPLPETLIHLEGVDKVFTTDDVETNALSNIQLNVNRGAYIWIEGPSDCGKSNFLASLGLLDTPSNGCYVLNGRPVEKLKMSDRVRIRDREIGFTFQAFNLIGDLTVYERVELLLTYRGMSASERKKRTREADA